MSIPKSRWITLMALMLIFFSFEKTWSGEEEKPAKEKELPEWVGLQTQLSTLDSKMNQKKDAIARLIEEKQKLPADSPEIKADIDEMVSEYKELLKVTDEFDKKMTIFKFRYPERGVKEERKYGHPEVKSLDQMEQELGIDGRLNRNLQKMRSQYGKIHNPGSPDSLDKASQNAPTPNNQKSIDETGTIILKK